MPPSLPVCIVFGVEFLPTGLALPIVRRRQMLERLEFSGFLRGEADQNAVACRIGKISARKLGALEQHVRIFTS